MGTLRRKWLGLLATLLTVIPAAIGVYGFASDGVSGTVEGLDTAMIVTLGVVVAFVVSSSVLAVAASRQIETPYW